MQTWRNLNYLSYEVEVELYFLIFAESEYIFACIKSQRYKAEEEL